MCLQEDLIEEPVDKQSTFSGINLLQSIKLLRRDKQIVEIPASIKPRTKPYILEVLFTL
jgi:hypothetical protein